MIENIDENPNHDRDSDISISKIPVRIAIGTLALVVSLNGYLAVAGIQDYGDAGAYFGDNNGENRACSKVDGKRVDVAFNKLVKPPRSKKGGAPQEIREETYQAYAPEEMDAKFSSLSKKAESFSLTIDSPGKYIHKIYDSDSNEQVLAVAQDYFASHGIKLTTPAKGDGTDDKDLEPAELENLGLFEFQDKMQSLIYYFAQVPKEVIALANVEEIELFDRLPQAYDEIENESFYAAGTAEQYERRIRISLSGTRSGIESANIGEAGGLVLLHELVHHLDYATCGRNANNLVDPQYKNYSESGFEYGDSALADSDSVFERYGARNVSEDKATAFTPVLGLKLPARINAEDPITRKMALLAVRIDKKVPGYLDFIDAAAMRDEDLIEQKDSIAEVLARPATS